MVSDTFSVPTVVAIRTKAEDDELRDLFQILKNVNGCEPKAVFVFGKPTLPQADPILGKLVNRFNRLSVKLAR